MKVEWKDSGEYLMRSERCSFEWIELALCPELAVRNSCLNWRREPLRLRDD